MRLIDADKLIENIDDRYSLGEIGRRERDDIVNALEYNAPTIEVVCCRECKWYNCNACFRDDGANNERSADDFCSCGCRKEN